MAWDEMVEERARARNRRLSMLTAALAGDSLGVMCILLGYFRVLDWLIAIPFAILGWSFAGYIFWRVILGNRAGRGRESL